MQEAQAKEEESPDRAVQEAPELHLMSKQTSTCMPDVQEEIQKDMKEDSPPAADDKESEMGYAQYDMNSNPFTRPLDK